MFIYPSSSAIVWVILGGRPAPCQTSITIGLQRCGLGNYHAPDSFVITGLKYERIRSRNSSQCFKIKFWLVFEIVTRNWNSKMTDTRLQAELWEAKAEVQRLRERVLLGAPTIHKDLYLVVLVPRWSGQESTVALEEFFASIEGSARIGRWKDLGRIEISTLKLRGRARNSINDATSSMLRVWRGKNSKRRSGKDIKTSTVINVILWNTKQLDRRRTRILHSSLTDAEIWGKRLIVKWRIQ